MKRSFPLAAAIAATFLLALAPMLAFAAESGAGYTVYDEVDPVTGLVSGSGFDSQSGGDPISQTVSGGGYVETGGIYHTEITSPTGTTGSGSTGGSGTTGGTGTGTTGGGTTTGGTTTGGGGSTGGGGTGSGHGGTPTPVSTTATATFKGQAYPGSVVTLTEDGGAIAEVTAGSDASFSLGVSNLTVGNYIFGISSVDSNGTRSILQTFPMTAVIGETTAFSGILLPPTIGFAGAAAEENGTVSIGGETAPGAEVIVNIQSSSKLITGQVTADAEGVWLYKLDTSGLPYDTYTATVRALSALGMSGLSAPLSFTVGTAPVIANTGTSHLIEDINDDGKIDLLDFSILLYWFGKTGFPPAFDLNGDGKIDMLDFSIMMYYWTS